MAFERKELNENLINSGEKYENGDSLQPTAVNEIVGAVLNLQESGGADITIDSELSTSSENPVQNKVITTALNEKVGKTTGAYRVYATNANGEQIVLKWGYVATAADIVPVRDTGGNIIVPKTPAATNHAASKQYVDELVANASGNGGGGSSAKLYRHSIRCMSADGYVLWFKILSSQSTPYEDSWGGFFMDIYEKLPIPVMLFDSSGYNPVAMGIFYDSRGRIFALDNEGAFISIRYDEGISNFVDTVTEV